MKLKLLSQLILTAAVITAITFSGCKRKKTEEPEPTVNTTTVSNLSKDDNEVESASDDAMNDANDVMSRGTSKDISLPCHVTLDTVLNDSSTITFRLTYAGLNCNGTRNRSGQIEITKSKNTPWSAVNASVTVKLINFKVTRVVTGKSITLNGTKTFVNVSGGLVKDLVAGTNLSRIHTVTGSLEILFDNGTTKTWNVSRKRTISGTTPNNLVIDHQGTGSADGYDNLVTWGFNRDNEAFYTQITTTVRMKETCQWYPAEGQKVYSIPSDGKKATITFGFDNNDTQLPSGSTTCPTKYKFEWSKTFANGTVKSGTSYIAY